MLYVVSLAVFTILFSPNLFCMEKADYKQASDDYKKKEQQETLEYYKQKEIRDISKTHSVSTEEAEKIYKQQIDAESGKIPQKSEPLVKKIAPEKQTWSSAKTPTQSYWHGVKIGISKETTAIPRPLSESTKISSEPTEYLKTVTPLSFEKFETIQTPKELTDKEKNQVIELGDKLLKIGEENFNKLSAEDQLKSYLLIRTRVLQLQMGDKVLAGIGESRKGIERAIGNEINIEKLRDNGVSEEKIKEMVDEKKDQDPYKLQLDKLYQDEESLKDKFGFDKNAQKEQLTKAYDILGTDIIEKEKELRKNILTEKETELTSMLKQKKLTTAQKVLLQQKGSNYCKTFVDTYKKLTNEEDQQALFKNSKTILSKVRAKFISDNKKVASALQTVLKATKRDAGNPEADAKIEKLTKQIEDIKQDLKIVTGKAS